MEGTGEGTVEGTVEGPVEGPVENSVSVLVGDWAMGPGATGAVNAQEAPPFRTVVQCVRYKAYLDQLGRLAEAGAQLRTP